MEAIPHIPRIPQQGNLNTAAAAVEAALAAELVACHVALVQSAREAVETLRYIMLNGRGDEFKLAAANAILDKAGLSPEVNVNIGTVDMDRESRIDELTRKLATMRTGLMTEITPTPAPIDATATG